MYIAIDMGSQGLNCVNALVLEQVRVVVNGTFINKNSHIYPGILINA